ncbi:hypothetical protein SAMN05421878_1183 [Actinobaculum suis]|uniref:Uncharacterized protein n=1 Tax=Actinobaculum suis TaxID=1657 RepID=A0A1G7EHJ7_9ACTO|nr:hypothetical protein SAMN05421878_1183 [Actinobaculum suis]
MWWVGKPRQRGLIPACAGSTYKVSILGSSIPAHPRLRGEHHSPGTGFNSFAGSSPPARGARKHKRKRVKAMRLIPACAGSTDVQAKAWPSFSAHPRLRGEHAAGCVTIIWEKGSSPPARGALDVVASGEGQDRLIPACAGSTSRAGPPGSATGAHPRLRGEHSTARMKKTRGHGSSPPARGARIASNEVASANVAHPRLRGEHTC